MGKNNGDYNGKYYFNIEKKDDKAKFGVFVKSKALTLLNGTAVDDLLKLPMPKAEPKQETKH